jgi:hypothetical protein
MASHSRIRRLNFPCEHRAQVTPATSNQNFCGSLKRQFFRRICAFLFFSQVANRISEGDLKFGRCVKVGALPLCQLFSFRYKHHRRPGG